METNNMENLIIHSVNSYVSNLLCLQSAHKLSQDIHAVLLSDIMQETFRGYLQTHARKYPTESLLIQELLRTDHEALDAFQAAYEDLKNDLAGNYTNPTPAQLQEINDEIQSFSKKRKQYDRWVSLGANKKLNAA